MRRSSVIAVAAVFLMGVLHSLGGSVSVSGQESAATPTTVAPRQSLAFEFYPTDSGWGSYFDWTIDAGESAELTVTITNVGDVTQGIRTYVSNGFTAPGGGFAASEYGEPLNEVSQWLDYPEKIYTLEAGTGIERTFTVTVPAGTAPGQYLTAIAGEHAEASAVEGQPNLSQKLRYSVPVFITVPGETETSFEVDNIDLDTVDNVGTIVVGLRNTGDIRVRPAGTIELRSPSGELIASIPIAMESIYARDRTDLRLPLPPGIGSGEYTVSVDLKDPESGALVSAEEQHLELFVAGSDGQPVVLTFVSGQVLPEPEAGNVQYVTVNAVISNTGDPVAAAQLSLVASVNGQEVERFPVSQSLSLPNGETSVSARYIPITGWTAGEWTFELLLETVGAGGAAVVVAVYAVPESLEIE